MGSMYLKICDAAREFQEMYDKPTRLIMETHAYEQLNEEIRGVSFGYACAEDILPINIAVLDRLLDINVIPGNDQFYFVTDGAEDYKRIAMGENKKKCGRGKEV